jgi:hypothetical protein
MRAHELAPMLIFSPSDFFDPTLFFFDFGIFINQLRVPGWVAGLRSYLNTYGVCMPAVWLQPHEEHEGSNITGAMEREQLQSAFLELAGESWRPRTLINLRHPALKAL